MNQRYKYLLKNTSILTISNFSSKILVFLLVPLYTGILSTKEYGIFDLVVSTIQLLMPFLSLNIYEAVMRFLMDKESDKRGVVSVGLKYVVIGSLLFGILILINKKIIFSNELEKLPVIIFIYFSSYLFYQYIIQFSKGMEKVQDVAIASVIGTISTIGLNIILLLFFHRGLYGFFLAYTVGQLLPAMYLSIRIKLHKYIIFKIDKVLEKRMISYSLPLIMNSVGWWVNNVSDRYVVTFLCGISINGIYSVAYKIPSILNIIQQIFIQAWQISVIKEYDTYDSAKFYGQALEVLNFVMCILCMGLVLLTRPIARFLYSNEFYLAWRYVPFLLVSCVFNSASGILGPILSASKNSKAMGMSAMVGALTNIVFNFGLVYFIGAQGAAIATAISSFVIYRMRRKAVKNDISNYSRWALYMSWVFIIIQAYMEIYIEQYIFQFFLIGIVIILYRRIIVEIYKKIKIVIR